MSFLRSSSEFKWNLDLLICATAVIIAPYFIFDAALRGIIGRSLFQTDWLVITLALVRLIWILLLPGKTNKKYQISNALQQYYWIFILVFYTLFLTVIQPFLIDIHQVNSELFETYSFTLKRGIKYVTYLIFSVYFFIISRQSKYYFDALLYSLVIGLCLAELLGLIQALVFQISRIDIFPIIRTGSTEFRYISATVSFAGRSFLRINSIAHEPKGFASLISFLAIFKLYWENYCKTRVLGGKFLNKIDKYMCQTLWLSILVILLTFSGSGLISCLPVFVIISWRIITNVLYLKISKIRLLISYLLILILTIAITTYQNQSIEITSSFLDAAIYRRLGTFFEALDFDSLYKSLDPEDGAFFFNLLKYPLVFLHGLGFGAFSNLSFDFVASQYSQSNIDRLVSPFSRNILIETVFSSGLVGCFIIFRFIRKYVFFSIRSIEGIHSAFLMFLAMNFFFRSNEFLFFIAIAMMLSSLDKRTYFRTS
ncbi:hypothetical protein SPB21_12110 [Leptothoe sp. ISB3NOV94-8A]